MVKTELSSSSSHLITELNPLGRFWDEMPASQKRQFHGHPSLTSQLGGFGAPAPTPESNEDPLIKEKMKTFPDSHPSFGSVRNQTSMGCPAIVHTQLTSDMWKSTYQATIDEKTPTIKGRPEGKRVPPPLIGSEFLYFEPREELVVPPGAPPTFSRDQRLFKHVGSLTRQGRW